MPDNLKFDVIKNRMMEINREYVTREHNEGYLQGLYDFNVIFENEYEQLMRWLKSVYES